jgi:preprotein translocase subunit SecA
MRKQREVIYAQRREILFRESIVDTIYGIIDETVAMKVDDHTIIGKTATVESKELLKDVDGSFFVRNYIDIDDCTGTVEEVIQKLQKRAHEHIELLK